MILSVLLILSLIFATVVIHLEGLWFIRSNARRLANSPRLGLSALVLMSLALHVIEIILYGVVYLVSDRYLNIGSFSGSDKFDTMQYFYFSAETFTALGYGDVLPTGDLRLIATAEPLNGLTLISWSGAYTFVAMQRFWVDRVTTARGGRPAPARPPAPAGVKVTVKPRPRPAKPPEPPKPPA